MFFFFHNSNRQSAQMQAARAEQFGGSRAISSDMYFNRQVSMILPQLPAWAYFAALTGLYCACLLSSRSRNRARAQVRIRRG